MSCHGGVLTGLTRARAQVEGVRKILSQLTEEVQQGRLLPRSKATAQRPQRRAPKQRKAYSPWLSQPFAKVGRVWLGWQRALLSMAICPESITYRALKFDWGYWQPKWQAIAIDAR